MKKKSIFVLLVIMAVLVGGGYYLHNPQEIEVELEEVCDSIGYEDSLDIAPLDTLSVDDDLFEAEYLDTLCMIDGKYIYVGTADCFRTRGIFMGEKLLLEDPMLDYPWGRDGFVESCKIGILGKVLHVDFRDSASIAQLSALGKIHPEVNRFQRDTLADFGRNIQFLLTVDFPQSSHEKAKEIERWLMDIGYDSMSVDDTLAIAINKDEWVDILAGKFFQDVHLEDSLADLYPSAMYKVLDLRDRIFTDKYVTYQKYTHNYLGGAHGYYTERLVSYDYIHKESMDWNYLFKEQYHEKVWQLLCETVNENEKYRICYADDDLEDVESRLKEAHKYKDEMELGLGDKGVIFSYQPYEIGSFADGTFHFTISYEKLTPYLTDKAKWCLEY